MKQGLFSRRRRRIGAAGIVVTVAACWSVSPALATTTATDTSGCSAPTLTQPFLSVRDSNWYTLVPGEGADKFDGGGWALTGGASIQTRILADGNTGQILDLPSGSKAVSPTICVNGDFRTARTEVRNVVGGEGVQFYVSYAGTNTWNTPKNTGQVHGTQNNWTLSDPVNVQPSGGTGWQLVRFTFVPGGKTSDFQIYNFYVDPRCR